MEDRRENLMLEMTGSAKPDPAPVPPAVPGPIPWICREPVSKVPPVHGLRHRFKERKLTAHGDPSMEQSEGRDFIDGRSEIVREAPPLVSCFWCERLHPGEHPLSVCPACAARCSTTRSLKMSGPYALSDEAIDEVLTRTLPGNYALGDMNGDTFNVFYVGRSDSDVRQRLHEWVGMPSRYEGHASPANASWGGPRRGPLPVDAPALGRVGNAERRYTRFAYSYARSAEEAYAKEWRNYDAFGGRHGLDNDTQPVFMKRSPEPVLPRIDRTAVNANVSLSGLDSAFLSLETPSTPMHMMGTFVLDASRASGGYSFERIIRLVEERMPDLAPFRRRLAAMPFGFDHPVWIDDSDLRIRSHVYRVGAPAPGSEQDLASMVAQIAAQPLDRTRPLWELWVIEGLAEGRVALVFKVHHAVADGASAVQLLLQLLDSSPEGMNACGSRERVRRDLAPTSRALLAHALSRLPQRSARFARLLRDTTRSIAELARSMIVGAANGPRMPMPFSGPRTPWNGATSPQRTVAFGSARLADAKFVGSVFHTTVNHVVLAACTQTLRNYLEAHGGAPDAPLVAAIPVSLRNPEELETYGNRISAFLVHLPVHLADPVDQLLAVRHDAASSKEIHAQLGVSALGEWAEFTSTALLTGAARFYSDRKLASRHPPLHNLVISNVRGPGTPLYAAGARVTAAYPLGPLMEGAGMNITVVSYMDSIDFGIVACERSVPHVADIARGFGAAVADLFKIALDKRLGPPSAGGVGATPDPASALATAPGN
jgi:diacylglycerol O-acyltransferase